MRTPALFPLGCIHATPGALLALAEHGQTPAEFLARHQHGDWAEMAPEDAAENCRSVRLGYRILSTFALTPDDTRGSLWIITEADRSLTTLLLRCEY